MSGPQVLVFPRRLTHSLGSPIRTTPAQQRTPPTMRSTFPKGNHPAATVFRPSLMRRLLLHVVRMTLTEFLQLISSRGSLERARIQSVQCYEVDDGAHHRFLLFYCIPQSRSSVWFRVDRQRQRHLSLEVPLLNRGCVDTHDTVRLGAV